MDKINNYTNQYNTPMAKDQSKVLNKSERMNILIPKSKEVFSQIVEKEVPENGNFRKVFITMSIPESQNQGLIAVEESSKDSKNLRNLLLGVRHKDRDRLASVYLLQNCPKAEIIKFLNDNSNIQDIIDTINKLSDETDDYYSSL